MVAVSGGINRYVHTWDEFSHWGYDAKAVISFDKLSNTEEIISRTRSYPPIISLFHYFVSIFTGYSEPNLYIGLSLFVIINLMTVFNFIKKENLIFAPLIVISTIFGCSLLDRVYFYDTLYADLAIASIFSTSFIMYLIFKDNLKSLMKHLFITLSILVLTKPTGIVMAFTFILVMLLVDYIKLNDNKLKFNNLKSSIITILKKWWKLVLAICLVYGIWLIYVKVMNIMVHDYYDYKLLPNLLESAIKYKLDRNIILGFIRNLLFSFDEKIMFGLINISFMHFTIIIFGLLLIAFYLKNKISFYESICRTLPYLIGYIAFWFLTVLSIFVMFSAYETARLASFSRYMNGFTFALIIFLIAYISRVEFLNNKKNKIFALIIYFGVIFNLSFTNITYFISDYELRIETREFSDKMNDKFKVVNENTEKNSKVYIIDQQDNDGMMAMWYSRYYLFPRKVNASSSAISWKIRTDKNVADLQDWGMTAAMLGKHLNEYNFDYIYFYTEDEQMLEKMSFMFDDIEASRKCVLFKIEKCNDSVKLIAIK